MPKTAFEVATILDEIIKNADPLSVMSQGLGDLVQNARQNKPAYRCHAQIGVGAAPDRKETYRVTMEYAYPVEQVMKGVEGTVEDVVDWLNTGSTQTQQVALEVWDREQHIILRQIHDNDKFMWEEATNIIDRWESMINRKPLLDGKK